MRKELLLALVLFSAFSTYAQSWQWGRGNTGNQVDAYRVATDSAGNVYGAGAYIGEPVTFGTTVLSGYSVVWAKYNNSGNLLWAGGAKGGGVLFDGPHFDSIGCSLYNICTDPSGNLIVFGYFGDSLQIGTSTLYATAPWTQNYFLAKISPSGSLIWAVRDGSVHVVQASSPGGYYAFSGGSGEAAIVGRGSVTTDAAGNIYITSNFSKASMSIGPYVLTNSDPSGTTADIFLAKYTPSGSLVWATSAGGSSDDCAYDIKASGTGNLYVCGVFYSPAWNLGPSLIANPYGGDGYGGLPGAGSPKAYIAEFSSASGLPLWAQAATGSHGSVATALACDASGNTYMTGGFLDTSIGLGATTITRTYPATAPELFALFLARYSPAGVITWSKTIGSSATEVFGYSVALAPCNKIWVEGSCYAPVNIDGTVHPVAPGPEPVILAGYTISGGLFDLASLGAGADDQSSIACDYIGNVFICDDYGHSTDPLVIGPDTLPTPSGGEWMYLGKYGVNPSISIAATPGDTICSGTPVTFNSTVSGTVISTRWYVNSTIVAFSGSSYTYIPSNGDSVSCVIIATGGPCPGSITVSSNTIVMVVDSVVSPSINITASPGDTACAGMPVTCSATITGGGTAPAYQWLLNSGYTSGLSTYTFTPVAGDSVQCMMTSSYRCAVPATAASNIIHFTVVSTDSVFRSADTAVCSVSDYDTSSLMAPPGSNYYWYDGTTNIQHHVGTGGTMWVRYTSGCAVHTDTFHVALATAPLPITGNNKVCLGDSIVLADWTAGGTWSSDLPAVASIDAAGILLGAAVGPAIITYQLSDGCNTTKPVTVLAPPCITAVSGITNEHQPEITPNPATNELIVTVEKGTYNTLCITNNVGRQLLQQQIAATQTAVNIQSLPPGIYFITLKGENGMKTEQFVKM